MWDLSTLIQQRKAICRKKMLKNKKTFMETSEIKQFDSNAILFSKFGIANCGMKWDRKSVV